MLSSFLRSSASQRASTSVAAFLAFSVSARPTASSTLMEQAPPSPSLSSLSSSSSSSSSGGKSCPPYGCPLYPQDVYYNPAVKEALARLRERKRDDHDEDDDEFPDGGGAAAVLDPSGGKRRGTLTLIGYKGGTLESQINQDRALVVAPFLVGGGERETREEAPQGGRKAGGTQHGGGGGAADEKLASRLIGVFDGHARLGEVVSQYSVTELPRVLAAKLDGIEPRDDPDGIARALVDTFVHVDRTAPAETSGGCTASVILQRNSKLFVANAGDSRSFLAVYRADSQTVEVIYISREDKPHLPDERARVERMGGEVYLPAMGTSRVLYTDPETGLQSGLAMSRSLGDWEVGRLGVIPDPIVAVLDIREVVEGILLRDCQIPEEDEAMSAACFSSSDDIHIFAVCATDGLTDFVTPDIVAQTVATSLYHRDGPHLLSALEQLIYLAAQGWEQTKQGRYRDDIAISVSEIRIPPSRPAQ